MLRGLDGHGHFKTISIFLKRRTPYKKYRKNYPILKLKYLDFSLLNVIHYNAKVYRSDG